MNKLIYFLAAGCLALPACTDDIDLRPDDEPQINDDGTITTDKAEFLARPDGFMTISADQARTAIASHPSTYLTDTATHAMCTATYIPPVTTLVSDDTPAGRGKPFNSHSTDGYGPFDTEIGTPGVMVTGVYTAGGVTTNWFDQVAFPRNGGRWKPATDIRIPYNGGNISDLTLYSWTQNGGTNVEVNGSGENTTLTYTVPHFACEQADIMAATISANVTYNNKTPTATIETLRFKHILGGLRVRVASRPGQSRRVNRIDIDGVKYKGTYSLKNQTWTVQDETQSIWTSYQERTSGGYKNLEDKPILRHHYNEVLSDEQTFMLLPQTFTSSTVIRVIWNNGATTQASLNGLRIERGKILYLDFQEPSIYAEDFVPARAYREKGGNEDLGAYLKEFATGATAGGWVYFRLHDDPNGSYYTSIRPVCWNKDSYNSDGKTGIRRTPMTESEDNSAWDNNDRRFYSHSNMFNLVVARQDGHRYYYACKDIRQNFFVTGKKIDLRYRCIDDMETREYIMHCWGNAPNSWSYNPDTQATGSPWECLGGEIYITITPDKPSEKLSDGRIKYPEDVFGNQGSVQFDPVHTNDHPICYPYRIPITGSIEGWPFITVQPHQSSTSYSIKGDKKNVNNVRSFRMHYLPAVDANGKQISGNTRPIGRYRSTRMPVMQFAPYENGYMWHYNSPANPQRYHGSVIMFSSTMHGSFGMNAFPYDEFVSRLGIAGTAGVNYYFYNTEGGAGDGRLRNTNVEVTIKNYTRTFTTTQFWLPTGVYTMDYNMAEQTLYCKRTGLVLSNEDESSNGSSWWKTDWSYHSDSDVQYKWYEGPYYNKVRYPGMSAFGGWTKTTINGQEGFHCPVSLNTDEL